MASVADAVATDGWCAAPGFLDPGQVETIAAEARSLWEEGEFHRAAVGRGREREVRSEVRSDWILWLDPAEASPAIARYLGLVEALRRALNELLYLGLFELEAHLTVYPPGASYGRHLDRFRGTPTRTVSLLLYLNRDWGPEDGGALRLYRGEDGASDPVDVEPRGGTLAVFLSDRFWHEVLPARRERLSITGWLKTREV